MTSGKMSYIEWDYIGLCGLIGESGSGKTSTMRFLLAQMAMGGTGIILIDGHGRMNTETQTLAQSCEPLSAAYIIPPAIEDGTIVDSIRMARDIAQARLDGTDDSRSNVALVIDEFVSVLGRMDKHDSDFTIATLLRFATDFRKTGVKVFIAAQDWTKDFVGAASVRKNMNTKILHRVAPDAVQLFTNNGIIKKTVPNMRVGEAFVLQANVDPVKVYVPKITTDDLKAIKNRVIPFTEYAKLARNTVTTNRTVVSDFVAPDSEISTFVSQRKTQELLNKWYVTINNCVENGMTKTQIIQHIWRITPGTSKKYKTASRIYDYLRERML